MTAYLDMRAAAARLGVDYATVRRYRATGNFPPADVRVGQSPGWLPETLDAWQAARPGRGVGGGRPRRVAELREQGPLDATKRPRLHEGDGAA